VVDPRVVELPSEELKELNGDEDLTDEEKKE
jgi:hypothetical protein